MKKRGKNGYRLININVSLIVLILFLIIGLNYFRSVNGLKDVTGNFYNLNGKAVSGGQNFVPSPSIEGKTRVLLITSKDINKFKNTTNFVKQYATIESMLPPFIIAHIDNGYLNLVKNDLRIIKYFTQPITLNDISFTNLTMINKVILRRWNSEFPGQKGIAALSGMDDNLEIDYWDLPINENENYSKFVQTSATYPLTSLPNLTSKNESPIKLYLDFDGDQTDSWWGYSNITTPVFSQDGDLTTFSDNELAIIEQIWERVSEKYSPYNVSVTTIEPNNFSSRGFFPYDPQMTYGIHLVIGGNGAWTGSSPGGIAIVGSYVMGNNRVFIFEDNGFNGNAKYLAEACSHESGHGFGLLHQSSYNSNGTKIYEYNPGNSNIAPVMGNSYSSIRGIWWNGTDTNSNSSYQNDLNDLSLGLWIDDYGNSINSSYSIQFIGNNLNESGIIHYMNDSDYFSFNTTGGNLKISVTLAEYGPTLDSAVSLYFSNNTFITMSNTSSLSENLNADLSNGTYYIKVFSDGSYGDVGQYILLGNISGSPEVTLLNPSNNLYTSSGNVNFIGNFSNYISFDNSTLYIWNSSNALINTTVNEITGTINSSNILFNLPYEGGFKWNYLVYSINNEFSFATTNFTVIYDSTNPQILFGNNTEDNDTTLTRNNLIINVTVSDTNLVNITISVYNSTGIYNTTIKTSSPNYVNITNLSNGVYYFNATTYDLANNFNKTETRIIYITENIPPIIINPRNFNASVNKSFSNYFNATDNVNVSRFRLNDTSVFIINQTTGLLTNRTRLVNISFYWLNLTVNDTSGNIAFLIFYINVSRDTTPPVITFSCTPSSVNIGETINCTCFAIDEFDNDFNVSFVLNPVTSIAGSFITSCNATDDDLNNNSVNFSYTVNTPSDNNGGGGGGGSGGGSVVVKKNITQNNSVQTSQNKTIVNVSEIIEIISEESLEIFTDQNNTFNVSVGLDDVNWYINDVLVSSGSKSFNFIENESGNYTVKAELINDQGKQLKIWKVKVSNKEKQTPKNYSLYILIVAIMIGLIFVLIVILVMKPDLKKVKVDVKNNKKNKGKN